MRLLLLEDDPASQKMFSLAMRRQGHAIDVAESATAARGMVLEHPYDVLVVDIGLPEGPHAGLGFVSGLREFGNNVPVLFLSALGDLNDRLSGLNIGGDDYMVKPCHLSEVDARLHALVRRNQPMKLPTFRLGGLEINWVACEVRLDGLAVALTAKEYAILALLAGQGEKTFSREEIIARVWDEAFLSDDKLVNTYIKTLRQKLGDAVIVTVRGFGYRLGAC